MSESNAVPSLLGLNLEQLEAICRQWKEPAYRGRQIYKWLYNANVEEFEQMSNIPRRLRAGLSESFALKALELAYSELSSDGTRKYLWKLTDGQMIESVLIPEARRATVCISSQVGCALGCHFCATAKMGFLRNLTAGEIIDQVLQIKRRNPTINITNVVFMGMGEPFLNYREVIKASGILGDPEGVAIANRRITISTSGISPRIGTFAEEKQPFGLAVSLHAPNQVLREQIMPLAKKFPLNELMASIKFYLSVHKRRRVTFEYVLLENVNDSPEIARELVRLLSGLRCKLNIIPYNQTDMGFRAPSAERIENFVSIVMDAPFTVTVRKNRGQDISAACGQLYAQNAEQGKRKSRYLEFPIGLITQPKQ